MKKYLSRCGSWPFLLEVGSALSSWGWPFLLGIGVGPFFLLLFLFSFFIVSSSFALTCSMLLFSFIFLFSFFLQCFIILPFWFFFVVVGVGPFFLGQGLDLPPSMCARARRIDTTDVLLFWCAVCGTTNEHGQCQGPLAPTRCVCLLRVNTVLFTDFVFLFTVESPAFHKRILAASRIRELRRGSEALRTKVQPSSNLHHCTQASSSSSCPPGTRARTSPSRRCRKLFTRSAASEATCFDKTKQFTRRRMEATCMSYTCRKPALHSSCNASLDVVPTGCIVDAPSVTYVRM